MRSIGLAMFATQLTTVALSAQTCGGGEIPAPEDYTVFGHWVETSEYGEVSLSLDMDDFSLVGHFADSSSDFWAMGTPRFFESGLVRLPINVVLSPPLLPGYYDCFYNAQADELECQGSGSSYHLQRSEEF